MGIGGSIFLIALGAIIAFGVRDQNVGPLDLTVVGWVIMLAGIATLLITLWVWNSRRRRIVAVTPTTAQRVERRQVVQAPPQQRQVVEEERWAEVPPEAR